MYEQFKNQIVMSLSQYFDAETVNSIIDKINLIANDYDINLKTKELVSYAANECPLLLRTYIACKKVEGLSEQTLYNYGHYLQIFFRTLQKEPKDVNPNDIRVFLYRYQETTGISNRTLDKYRTYITSFFRWAIDEEYLERNPAKSIKPIKYEAKPRQALTQIELEYLRLACDSVREQAMVEFLYSTGCRISELACVKKNDIDWKDKKVTLFGKGKKYRTSYLNAKAEVCLKQYLETRNDDCEYLFATIRKPYRQMHRAGLERVVRSISLRAADNINKKVTPHILRHTTATVALENGMPVEDISKLLLSLIHI